jgi:hypothetical protein
MPRYGNNGSMGRKNHEDPPSDEMTASTMRKKTISSSFSSSSSSSRYNKAKQLPPNNSSSSNPPEYLDPFFGPPPSWGLFSHDPRVQSSNSEDTLNLELYLTSETLVKVEILSSLQDTNFFLPLSLLIERELSMRQCAEDYLLKPDRWSGSLLYREWRNAIDDVSSTPDDRAFQQANGDVSIYLTPEADCALSNHSQTLVWTTSLTTCIRAYYNTGTVRFPNDCVGSDVLLALEYFGIVYTPNQLVFDSFGVYLRVKLWSEYFTHRSTLAQWVVETLMTSHSKHTHIFVTSPLEHEGDLLMGSHRVRRLEGNLKLDPRKYAGTRSHAVVHDFFNGDDDEALTHEDLAKLMGEGDQQKGDQSSPPVSLDVLMRDDFAQYLSHSLPGTTVTFQCKQIQHVPSGRMLKRATLQISFLDSRVPSFSSHNSSGTQINKNENPKISVDKPPIPRSTSQMSNNNRVSPNKDMVDKEKMNPSKPVKSRSSSPNPAAGLMGRVSYSLSMRRSTQTHDGVVTTPRMSNTSDAQAARTRTTTAFINMQQGQQNNNNGAPSDGVPPRDGNTVGNHVPQNSDARPEPITTVSATKLGNRSGSQPTVPMETVTISVPVGSPDEDRNLKVTQTVFFQPKLSNQSHPNPSQSKFTPKGNCMDNNLTRTQKTSPRASSPRKNKSSTNSSSQAPTDEVMAQLHSVAPSDEQNPYAQDHRAPVKTIWEGDLATVISAITSPFRDEDVITSRKLNSQNSSSKQLLTNSNSSSNNMITSSNVKRGQQQQQRQQIHQQRQQEYSTAAKNIPFNNAESTTSSHFPIPSTTDDDGTDARTDWNMSSIATEKTSRIDPSLQTLEKGSIECGGEDILSSAFHFMFGTSGQPQTMQSTKNSLTYANNSHNHCPNGCNVDANSLTGGGLTRGSSAMSTMEHFLPDIDLQARDDVEHEIPDSKSVTMEDSAAKWLRRAINFNHLIYDDPVVDNDDDEYLRLVRQAEASNYMGSKWDSKAKAQSKPLNGISCLPPVLPNTNEQCQAQHSISCHPHVLPKDQCGYKETIKSNSFQCVNDVTGNFKTCTNQTMETSGTTVKEMLDTLLMSDNNSMHMGSMASTEGSSAYSAYGSNSSPSTTQLKKAGPFIPLECDSSLESIEQAYLEKRNVAEANSAAATFQAEHMHSSELQKLGVLTYPVNHRRSRFSTPHPGALLQQRKEQQDNLQMSGKNAHNDKASTVRVPPWIGVKKRGKNRGDVTTETAQTAKVHNGELNQQQKQTTFNSEGNEKNEMDLMKPSTSRLAGLFRSKGLVRRPSLGEIKAKE